MKEQCPFELVARLFNYSTTHHGVGDLDDRELGCSVAGVSDYRFSTNNSGSLYYLTLVDK